MRFVVEIAAGSGFAVVGFVVGLSAVIALGPSFAAGFVGLSDVIAAGCVGLSDVIAVRPGFAGWSVVAVRRALAGTAIPAVDDSVVASTLGMGIAVKCAAGSTAGLGIVAGLAVGVVGSFFAETVPDKIDVETACLYQHRNSLGGFYHRNSMDDDRHFPTAVAFQDSFLCNLENVAKNNRNFDSHIHT